jgi:CRISPR/Cas system-associated exonuclease Cas4 (RecB family)
LHYISLWEMAEMGDLANKRVKVRAELRGYRMQPVPPDRHPQHLPVRQSLSVNDLSKTICSTHRDLYFLKIRRLRITDRPWEAEAGVVIHTLLQDIHRYAKRSLPQQGRSLSPENLLRKLKAFGKRRKTELLAQYQADRRFAGGIWNRLDRHITNIVFFEALLICTLLTYKASKKTVLATGANINPLQEYEELFSFSAIEQSLSARSLGITDPVTPDFLFGRRVIGDIKTGGIHLDTFETTCVAYALAYEAEFRRNIDYGIILHVGSSQQHSFPIYHGSHLFKLDDAARSRFLYLRDQKLNVLVSGVDPGRQEDQPRCRPCPFYNQCW